MARGGRQNRNRRKGGGKGGGGGPKGSPIIILDRRKAIEGASLVPKKDGSGNVWKITLKFQAGPNTTHVRPFLNGADTLADVHVGAGSIEEFTFRLDESFGEATLGFRLPGDNNKDRDSMKVTRDMLLKKQHPPQPAGPDVSIDFTVLEARRYPERGFEYHVQILIDGKPVKGRDVTLLVSDVGYWDLSTDKYGCDTGFIPIPDSCPHNELSAWVVDQSGKKSPIRTVVIPPDKEGVEQLKVEPALYEDVDGWFQTIVTTRFGNGILAPRFFTLSCANDLMIEQANGKIETGRSFRLKTDKHGRLAFRLKIAGNTITQVLVTFALADDPQIKVEQLYVVTNGNPGAQTAPQTQGVTQP